MRSNHYSKPTSQKDKVWKYIRRNKNFSFEDAMIVCGVSAKYLKTILWHLEGAGYIIRKNTNAAALTQRYYTHAPNVQFGIKSPSIVNGVLYDMNTNQEYGISKPKKEKQDKQSFKPIVLIQLLHAMQSSMMTKEEICNKADVCSTRAKRYWKRLEEIKVIRPALNAEKKTVNDLLYLRRNGKKLFLIDHERVKKVLEYINAGNYNKKTNSKFGDL